LLQSDSKKATKKKDKKPKSDKKASTKKSKKSMKKGNAKLPDPKPGSVFFLILFQRNIASEVRNARKIAQQLWERDLQDKRPSRPGKNSNIVSNEVPIRFTAVATDTEEIVGPMELRFKRQASMCKIPRN